MSSQRSPSPGSFGPPMPAFATSASSGSSNAARTASRSRMSTDLRRRAGDDVAQPRLVAREQRQARALVGEPLRDRAADARPGAGDDDVLALESLHAGESTAAARNAERSASALATTVDDRDRLQRQHDGEHRRACRSARAPSRPQHESDRRADAAGTRRTPRPPACAARAGCAASTSACIGALTSDMKKPATAMPASGTSQGAGSASAHSDAIWKRNATAPGPAGSTRRTMRIDDERADQRTAAERAEEPAEDPRVRVVLSSRRAPAATRRGAASRRRAA